MNTPAPVRVHLPSTVDDDSVDSPVDDWHLLFQDIVLHQQERVNKLSQRYQFAKQFLFPDEQRDGKLYLQRLNNGLNSFANGVLQNNVYIDFGSGKTEVIRGPHGQSSAIIHFLESTNRAAAEFQRFLDNTSTPEAVQAKCAALPADQCAQPCHMVDQGLFRKNKCGF